MNVPGVAGGTWSWRAPEADLDAAAPHLRELASLRPERQEDGR